jgi:hypothetical protein
MSTTPAVLASSGLPSVERAAAPPLVPGVDDVSGAWGVI